MATTLDAVNNANTQAAAAAAQATTYSHSAITNDKQQARYDKLLAGKDPSKANRFLNQLVTKGDRKDAKQLKQITVTEAQAEKNMSSRLAKISQEEFARYMQDFKPIEDDLVGSLDQSTVGRSMDAAQADAVRARSSLERMRERYGAGVTPDAAAAEARQNALSGALGQASAGSNAFVADRDSRMQTLSGLMDAGQTLRNQAMGNGTSAAGAESSRNQAYTAAKGQYAQQKAATQASAIGAVGSMAATAGVMIMV